MPIGAIWDEIWDEAIWNNAIWDDGVSDQTPDAFSFTDQFGITESTANVSSNTITVAGLGVDVDCSFTEGGHTTGEYNLNSGGWTDLGTFTISNGDQLQLRLDVSANYLETETIGVTIGTVSDTWSVTTRGDPSAVATGRATMTMGMTL